MTRNFSNRYAILYGERVDDRAEDYHFDKRDLQSRKTGKSSHYAVSPVEKHPPAFTRKFQHSVPLTSS
jgi:hypothetical protein